MVSNRNLASTSRHMKSIVVFYILGVGLLGSSDQQLEIECFVSGYDIVFKYSMVLEAFSAQMGQHHLIYICMFMYFASMFVSAFYLDF